MISTLKKNSQRSDRGEISKVTGLGQDLKITDRTIHGELCEMNDRTKFWRQTDRTIQRRNL